MNKQIQLQSKQVFANNRKFLKNIFGLSEDEYLKVMAKIGPSTAFLEKYKNVLKHKYISTWDASDPTRGWCAQMTRFLKDYKLIPDGYVAYTNNSRDHYYFINNTDEVIDLTLYQLVCKNNDDQLISYFRNKVKFNPVRSVSTKDAMKLHDYFKCFINSTPKQAPGI